MTQISFFLVMKRMEEICSGARPCSNSFLDQKIHLGLIAEGGFDTVYRTVFPGINGTDIMIEIMSTCDGRIRRWAEASRPLGWLPKIKNGRDDLADCFFWLIAFWLITDHWLWIYDIWLIAEMGKGGGWSPRCPSFDWGGLGSHFDVLLQGHRDNWTSFRELIGGGVVARSTRQ